MNGAGNRSSGQTGPASRLIRQRKRTDYCQLHLSSPFYRGQGPRLAYPALDNPRRNRIIPMNEMALFLGQRRPAFWVICCLILLVAEGFASADATKGHKNKRSLRSPFGNLRRGLSHAAFGIQLQWEVWLPVPLSHVQRLRRGHLLCSLSARRMSRSASRLAMVSRLSCSALPRQRPNCSFIRPSFR